MVRMPNGPPVTLPQGRFIREVVLCKFLWSLKEKMPYVVVAKTSRRSLDLYGLHEIRLASDYDRLMETTTQATKLVPRALRAKTVNLAFSRR